MTAIETVVGLGALADGDAHNPSSAADHAKSGPAGASGPGSTTVSIARVPKAPVSATARGRESLGTWAAPAYEAGSLPSMAGPGPRGYGRFECFRAR